MPGLPALVSRPLLDDVPAAADQPAGVPLQLDLTAGIPARIDLDGARGLVLAVPLGVVGPVLACDPLAAVFDTLDPDPAAVRPRLTLLDDGAIADTAAVVAGVPLRLGHGTAGVVEVVVERLRLTAGSLRSPGDYGSRLVLRWRDLRAAPATGPPTATGDPAIPRRATK